MRLGPLHPGELVRQVPARTRADVAQSRDFVGAGFCAAALVAMAIAGSVWVDAALRALDNLAIGAVVIDCPADPLPIPDTITYSGYTETTAQPIPHGLEIGDGVGGTLAEFGADSTMTVRGKIVVEGKNGGKIVIDPDALETGPIRYSADIQNVRAQ